MKNQKVIGHAQGSACIRTDASFKVVVIRDCFCSFAHLGEEVEHHQHQHDLQIARLGWHDRHICAGQSRNQWFPRSSVGWFLTVRHEFCKPRSSDIFDQSPLHKQVLKGPFYLPIASRTCFDSWVCSLILYLKVTWISHFRVGALLYEGKDRNSVNKTCWVLG